MKFFFFFTDKFKTPFCTSALTLNAGCRQKPTFLKTLYDLIYIYNNSAVSESINKGSFWTVSTFKYIISFLHHFYRGIGDVGFQDFSDVDFCGDAGKAGTTEDGTERLGYRDLLRKASNKGSHHAFRKQHSSCLKKHPSHIRIFILHLVHREYLGVILFKKILKERKEDDIYFTHLLLLHFQYPSSTRNDPQTRFSQRFS